MTLSAYTTRTIARYFQSDGLTYSARTGPVGHMLLLGAEIGGQVTDNSETPVSSRHRDDFCTPVRSPTIATPGFLPQSATDADNHVTNASRSIYGQDQLTLSGHLQLIAGVRYTTLHSLSQQ